MDNIEKEIKLINSIIEEAITHGGDPGGPYFINRSSLQEAIVKWLNFRNIKNKSIFFEESHYKKNYYKLSNEIQHKINYCQIIEIDEINDIQEKLKINK